MRIIPHSRPLILKADTAAVLKSLRSGQVSMGPETACFENEFSGKFGFKAAAAVASGSAALRLALLGLGVKPGDEVIIPTHVCTALLNAVHQIGAAPVLADVDAAGNISPQDVSRRRTARTRVIIAAHMYGQPADMKGLLETGLPVIEDCAQAIGARYAGRPVGTMGAVAVFSFYATKMLTSGEGGMVASDNRRLIDRVRDLLTYDHKPVYQVRYNDKMTDLQAALGRSQLQQLDRFISRRRELARRYTAALVHSSVRPPMVSAGTDPVFYRYVVSTRNAARLIQQAKAAGINCERPLFRPLHHYLRQKGYPSSERMFREAVSVPLYPALTAAEVSRIIQWLRTI